MALDRLPESLLRLITDLLLGRDILALMQSSPRLQLALSAPALWTKRTNLQLHEQSDQQRIDVSATSVVERYCQARSLLFHASDRRGSGIKVPFLGRYDFSFAMWFCLRPSGSGHPGGILLGAQTTSIATIQWPKYHRHFAVVDPHGDLYCSVLTSHSVVKSGLEDSRWYHLALTYDYELSAQCVYLDGTLVSRCYGELCHHWNAFRNWQIGSGCITASPEGKPTPDFCGWYPFQGLIDEYLFWDCTLMPEQVELLVNAKSTDVTLARKIEAPLCVVRAPVTQWQYGDIERVQCSRPAERWCEIWSRRTHKR